MRGLRREFAGALLLTLVAAMGADVGAQRGASEGSGGDGGRRGPVRTVTIPVTVRLPERREAHSELRYLDALTIFEDGEKQEILTTRGAPRAPLTFAVLIQDDLVSVGNEIRLIADFIRRLPPGSRVMVGYLRAGSLQVRQKFTSDLERAAKSLRIAVGSSSASPFSPYQLARDGLKRFEGQPVGRRAMLLVSDGLDLSRGVSDSLPSQSLDLQRAINEAQRRGVAVYSIFTPSAASLNSGLASNGQGSLNRLSTETGGRAFFLGTGAPVSFEPFLREIDQLLSRQFALTFLSTHAEKGFHKLRIVTDLEEGELYYPSGYMR